VIHLAKSFIRKLWLLLISIIVLGALFISMGRLMAPMISSYKGEVEHWASAYLEQPVSIRKLSARWHGMQPELVLQGVSLLPSESGQQPLVLSELRIKLGLLDSLGSLAIKPRRITLSGVQLLVKRRSDGTLLVSGLEAIDTERGSSGTLFKIPSRITLENADIYWENQLIGAAPVRLPRVDADLINAGDRHQLNASLQLPGASGSRLELKADIRGKPHRPDDWSAEFHLKGEQLAVSQLLKLRIPEHYSLPSGAFDTEIWGSWENGQFAEIEGSISLKQLVLNQFDEQGESLRRRLEISELGADFQWRYPPDGWALDIQEIQFDHRGLDWRGASFSMATRFDHQGRPHLRSGADFIRVQDLIAILRMFPLPDPAMEQALDQIQPESELHNLRFLYSETENGFRWSARGEVDDLSIQPWKQIPGIDNLQARFWVDQDRGTLQLNGRETTLAFPRLFRDPLQLQRLKGLLSWSRLDQGGWQIDTNEILAITRDIHSRTRLRMDFPSDPDASIFMDLQTDFENGDAVNAHYYYPVGIMPDPVVKWLDRSIVSGRVVSGSCVVRGPLRDFPFHRTHSGRFEVLFDTEDMVVDYWPGWPRLTEVSAEVRFLNNSFDTWLGQGTLFDSQVIKAHGRIRDLAKSAPFELRGEVEGPLQDNLRLLRESPLAANFSSISQGVRGEGNSRTILDFAVPLKRIDPFRLNGKLSFNGSSLHLEEWQLPLKNIQGDLQFDQDSVTATNIQASTLESRVAVDVSTRESAGNATRISTVGLIDSARLASHFPDKGLERLSGKGHWKLEIDIPPLSADPGTPAHFSAASDLAGIGVDLPPPFAKKPGGKRDFRISGNLGKEPRNEIRLRYAPLLDAAFLIEAEETGPLTVTRGDIRLDTGDARLPEDDGLEIRGYLKQLDLDPWIELMAEPTGNTQLPALKKLDLHLDSVQQGNMSLEQLDLDLNRNPTGFGGHIRGRQLEGQLQIPDDLSADPLKIRLRRLDLALNPDKFVGVTESPDKSGAEPDPTRLPGLDIEVEKVRINGHDFGHLQLISRKILRGTEFQTLSLNSSQMQLSASGKWVKLTSERQQTHLDLSRSSSSFGDMLSKLGFTRNIEQAPADIDSRLHWNGSPLEFSIGRLNGRISILLGRGNFIRAEPGIGRIFGLLNVGALQRRLSLDFSDLTHKGFGFDIIEGNFDLDQGDAYTNDLQIKGPGAQIDIAGHIGLDDESLDQLITVTPSISSALPVAGVLAGGPMGGAAMLLVQGLIGKQLNRVSQRQYLIKGPWDDPELIKLARASVASTSQRDQREYGPEDIAPLQPSDDSKTPKPAPAPPEKKEESLLKRLKKSFIPSKPTYPVERERSLLGD